MPTRIEVVTEPVLTDERRSELAALLDDEQRLRSEYPKVVDYLDMARKLPGSGNDYADWAFDLRFVHYMVGDNTSDDVNPYWDIVAPSVHEHETRRVVNGGQPDGSGRLAYAEMILQAAYAYAIPSPETLEWARSFCGHRPVLELGAGRGYWAMQLERVGLNVSAYDIEPPDSTVNVSFPQTSGQKSVWYPVSSMQRFEKQNIDCSDHVLFLCWPPGWGNTMASQALATFENMGGRALIYIGEPRGGKTGDDAFFDALTADWKLEVWDERFVSWWNVNDDAQAWVRR
jgi:hypothetical protein